ncbi:carbohydrate-binding family 9-like protein [Limibacter armeniacum]|uniref:carbohydrate-binding family 9-like protein n=1 Tax=Limibacter armeniacum TaxID=466084 RepID=UPI002FE65BE5
MTRIYFLTLFLLLTFHCGFTQVYEKPEEITPQAYLCYHSKEPLKIDGKLDDTSWEMAAWSADFVDIEGDEKPKPFYRTRIKLLWDKDYLYVGAEMEEPHIWGDITERDAVIFHNNDFEIFLDPDGDTHNYMEFEVNVLNTVWDLMLNKPYRNWGRYMNSWDMQGLKSAVSHEGTINNPNDVDRKWSVEIALPISSLIESSGKKQPKEGDRWKINFSRVQWEHELVNGSYQRKRNPQTRKLLPEYNWVWSPQGVINMHVPEQWGYLQFTSKPSGAVSLKPEMREEKIRRHLYDILSLQTAYRKQNGSYATHLKDLGVTSIKVGDEVFPLEMVALGSAFTVRLFDKIAKQYFYLREDSRSWIEKEQTQKVN